MAATSSSKSLDTVPLLIAGLCPLLPRPEQTQFRWVCSGHPPSPPFQSLSKHTDKFPLHVVGGIGNQYRQNLLQLITEVWHHFGVPVDTVDSQPPGHVPLELSRRHAASRHITSMTSWRKTPGSSLTLSRWPPTSWCSPPASGPTMRTTWQRENMSELSRWHEMTLYSIQSLLLLSAE